MTMKLNGLCRLGRDAEVRYLNDGTPVCNISGAWNFGRKGEDGKQATQWAEFSIFGDRVEKLHQYLVTGQQVFVIAGDVHIETYPAKDGSTGVRMKGRVESLDFGAPPSARDGANAPAPSANALAQRAPVSAQTPKLQALDVNDFLKVDFSKRPPVLPASVTGQQRPNTKPAGNGFEGMDDDIPF